MGFFSSIAKAVAGPAIGSIFGAAGQSSANRANIAQSREQMDFQREMSNTSYQRGVKDLRKAGLNPMLAYTQGGASTPSGTKADIGNVAKAGIEAASSAAAITNTRSQTELNEKTAQKVAAETSEIEARTPIHKATINKVSAEAQQIMSRSALNSVQYNLVLKQIDNAIKTKQQIVANTGNQKADTALKKIMQQLRRYETAGAANTYSFDKSTGTGGSTQRMLMEILKKLSSGK